ncbi:MAG: CDP-alcohol phosphatidyltransferase family protein [Actinomycetota bacterium]|nr:CDP-alcohol phosphatidyltransferase family protein [Actinomycetota bacterium]
MEPGHGQITSTDPPGADTMMAPGLDAAHAQKKIKTLFGWLLFRRVSLPLSLLVARTPVRPWQITALGLGLGLGAGALLGYATYPALVVGGVLALIAKLLDAMDGEVARAKHLETSGGYVADGLCDRLRDTGLIIGMGIGAYRTDAPTGLWWTIVAVAMYLGFFYVSAAFPSHWREHRSEAEIDQKHMLRVTGRIRLGAGDTLAVATFVGAVASAPLWPVVGIAVLGPVAIVMKLRRLFTTRPWEADDRQPQPIR